MPNTTISAFTKPFNGISLVLTTPVIIFKAFDPKTIKELPPQKQYQAIWDTGATNCCISEKVIDDLQLIPEGVVKVQTVDALTEKLVYLINVWLPNEVGIPFVMATEAKFRKEDKEDVLIGMDIINNGDFAITNKDGKTVFSFRTPSVECIDFVKQLEKMKSEDQYSGTRPNSPCPCGSGKKFKHCHGKASKK